MFTLQRLLNLLSTKEKKDALLLLFMVLVMAMLDLIGIASIMPFIFILTNPDVIETNQILFQIYNFSKKYGVSSSYDFLNVIGVIVFLLLLFSLLFKSITFHTQIHFSLMREYTIGKRLVDIYLSQEYSWFLNKNSSALGKNILSEVDHIITHGIQPMIHFFVQLIVVFSILLFLLMINILVAVSSLTILVSSYAFIYLFIRKLLNDIGKKRVKFNEQRYSVVNESFGGIKEVKFNSLENFYSEKFSNSAEKFSKFHALGGTLWQIPRYFVEAIAFGGIILSILYFMSWGNEFNNILPIIVVYAVAGYRLMPALNLIYISITKLKLVGPTLDIIHNHLILKKSEQRHKTDKKFTFKKSLNLIDIEYKYPESNKPALKNINIIIPAKSKIGIIGATGSGKTTLIDIILGILKPQKGIIEVDKKIIDHNNINSWQNIIGYVPQFIYLSDDSIAANIAYGSYQKDFDQEKIEHAARISQIHDFIVKDLPHKYDTNVGERGVRLSGGQRQRIGLARALYHDPKIIVLDEATSALDSMTENDVLKAIDENNLDTTIIAIAHRLSTIKNYDQIFYLDNGEIKVNGTYEYLLNSNNIIGEDLLNIKE